MMIQIQAPKNDKGVLLHKNEKVHFLGINMHFDENGIAVEDVQEKDLETVTRLGYTYSTQITVVRMRHNGGGGGSVEKIDRLYMESLEARIAELTEERNSANEHAKRVTAWADGKKEEIEKLKASNGEKDLQIEELKHTIEGMKLELGRKNEQITKLMKPSEQPQSAPAAPAAPVAEQPQTTESSGSQSGKKNGGSK